MLFVGKQKAGRLYYGKTAIRAMYYGARKIWGEISSCFGSGVWRSSLPWKSSDIWRN